MDEGSRIEVLYTWLASKPEADVDRLLAAGLEYAEPEYAARIAGLLVARKRETAWTGLVANYDRLPDEIRARLHEASVLVRAGIAAAMRGNARQQLNALDVLAQVPTPQLAYLAAEGLRARSPAVRARSADVLRVLGARVHADTEHAQPPDAAGADAGSQRQEVVRALRDALGSYSIHACEAVIEPALWFAGDLGDLLWGLLADARAGVRETVDRLTDGTLDARLATFLLLALAQPAWRARARQVLERWSRPEHLVAILRQPRVLAVPEIQRELARMANPPWFTNNVGNLSRLPADVRAQVPLWVGHLGYTAAQCHRCLQVWQKSQFTEVHRAAVFALAGSGTPEALRTLAGVAARPCPMGRFAKWYVAGVRGATRGASRRVSRGSGAAVDAGIRPAEGAP